MVAAGKNWEWGRAKRSGDAPTPAAQAFGSGQELKLGVLLLNLGGPERPEDVQPFLYNLFADPDIIRLPKLVRWLQAPIASVLAARRWVQKYYFCATRCTVIFLYPFIKRTTPFHTTGPCEFVGSVSREREERLGVCVARFPLSLQLYPAGRLAA